MDASLRHHSHKFILHKLESLTTLRLEPVHDHEDAPPPYDLGSYIAPIGSKYTASSEDDEDDVSLTDEDELEWAEDEDEDMFSDAFSNDKDDVDAAQDDSDQNDEVLNRVDRNDNPHDTSDRLTEKQPSHDPPAYSSRPSSPAHSTNPSAFGNTRPTRSQASTTHPRVIPPPNQHLLATPEQSQHTILIDATTRIHGSNNRITADFAHLGAKLADRILSHLTTLLPGANEANIAEAARSRGPVVVNQPTVCLTVRCGLDVEGEGNLVIGGQSVQQVQRVDGQTQGHSQGAGVQTPAPNQQNLAGLTAIRQAPTTQAEAQTIQASPRTQMRSAQPAVRAVQSQNPAQVQAQTQGPQIARSAKRERSDDDEDADDEGEMAKRVKL